MGEGLPLRTRRVGTDINLVMNLSGTERKEGETFAKHPKAIGTVIVKIFYL